MHTKRIIPCLDVDKGRVVKGINFVQLRDAGDPVEVARAYDAAGADGSVTAASGGREYLVLSVDTVNKKVTFII